MATEAVCLAPPPASTEADGGALIQGGIFEDEAYGFLGGLRTRGGEPRGADPDRKEE